MISAPLAAELLAAMINNERLTVATDLVNGLHPARFLVRELIKSQNFGFFHGELLL